MSTHLTRFLFASTDPVVVGRFRIALVLMIVVAYDFCGSPSSWQEPSIVAKAHEAALVAGMVLFALGWRTRVVGLGLALLLAPGLRVCTLESPRLLWMTLVLLSLLPGDDGRGSAGPMWPIRLVQLELSLLYGMNALAKTTPSYLGGDVLVGMSRMLPNFLVDGSDGVFRVGLLTIPVALAAVASVTVEWFLAIAFWLPRLRATAALVGIAFHAASRAFVTIGMLDATALFLYLAFLMPFAANAEESRGR